MDFLIELPMNEGNVDHHKYKCKTLYPLYIYFFLLLTSTRTCIWRKFISTYLPVYLPCLHVLESRLQRFQCRSISSLPVANSVVADDKRWWCLQLQTPCRQQSRVWQTTVRRKSKKQARSISTDATIEKFFRKAKAIVGVFISLQLVKRSLFYLMLLSGDEMLVRCC